MALFMQGGYASEYGRQHRPDAKERITFAREVVWAVNIGGAAYTGIDGVSYQADDLTIGGHKGRAENIRGSQTRFVYQTYREGLSQIQHAIENGLYDITFKFAEPLNIASGERVFSLFVEDELRIDQLDVLKAGGRLTAVDRTVSGVEVLDGQLNIRLQATKRAPIVSAIVVRTKGAAAKKWLLHWSDEFNRRGGLDTDKWTADVWPAGKVNDEDQAYTDRSENIRVEDGKLILEAHREKYRGARYTSGRIHARGKGDVLYGRIEVRARLPAGQGTWPAIWMLPSDAFKYASSCGEGSEWQGSAVCDAWPNSGEIDIMEHVGYDMNRIHGTVHNKAYYWVNREQRQGSVEGVDVSEAFHTYSLEWTPSRIDVFFDDCLYFSYVNESQGWQSWPYDHPYHVILNLAIGGHWGRAGGPIDKSIFPARMEVDYVRIYKPFAAPAE